MANTFNGATSFNRDLSSWNVDKVGSTCTRFEASAGAWTLSKPSLPASCIAFAISTNGVTVLCPTAAVGDTGVVKGVTYTKRDRQRLLELKVGFQRCRAGQVVHEWRDRYERHVQGCRQLQRGYWQLGHELGDHHGGHVQRRQHLQPETCPRGTWTRSVPPAPIRGEHWATWTLSKPSLPASCIAFAISTNGVTVLCPTATVGDTGVVKGVTYTKRDRQRLLELKGLPTMPSWPSRARVA